MAPHAYDVAEIPPPRASKPKRANRVLGDYTLSKTLGAGSMGKVKLATHNVTGEKLAVKILPRARVTSSASKEAGKEIRTLREAGLSLLLHHPYICGMREMIVHPNHYYMVFEYVNGGQLLDFIIAHGRLRERVARKFARQIASALDYCHRNNVVHRDLKIENILISQSGNIKIIDFGLSNLYNPSAHLSTFCGSLYFAAPELLNAKLYTGPEVDIWSFGVVLYTLVCGKVPFEDESMPALHAKIKRGLVEYPVWLSAECKHLLTRMLVINPLRRAPLSEIFAHPWMVRGYSAPPSSHLPLRMPLRPADLDPAVVARMAGFDFGADVEEVFAKLQDVLETDEYALAVLAYAQRRNGHAATPEVPPSPPASPSEAAKRRRFSGLDFYRRLFAAPPSPTPSPAAPPAPPPRDPTSGFHPLISMYHLAREKIEREEVYGVGVFASSQVSVAGADAEEREKENAPQNVEVTHEEVEEQQSAHVEETVEFIPSPPLPPPPPPSPQVFSTANTTRAADTSKSMNGAANGISDVEKVDVSTTPWPTSVVSDLQPQPTQDPPVLTEEPVVGTPPASAPETPAVLPEAPVEETRPPLNTTQEKDSADEQTRQEPETSRVEERARGRERGQSMSGGATLLRKFGGMFLGSGRHDGTGTGRRRESSKRASILGGAVLSAPPKDEEQARLDEKEVVKDAAPTPAAAPTSAATPVPAPDSIVSDSPPPPPTPVSPKEGQAFGSVRRRAATILDPVTRAARHERRSSTGGAIMAVGTVGRHRRTSMMGYETATLPKADRMLPTTLPEGDDMLERPDELSDGEGARDGHVDGDNDRYPGESKPVFLKGLLNVATTSTKPPPVIKADIRRVLDRMQVRYWPSKSGFECIHLPSINVSTLDAPLTPDSHAQHLFPSSGETVTALPRSGITKRVSRLSFSIRRVKSQERDFPFGKGRDGDTAIRPLSAIVLQSSATHQPLVIPDASLSPSDKGRPPILPPVKTASPLTINSRLPSIPDLAPVDVPTSPVHDFRSTGEMDRETFETMAHNALSVRFEINIVKVPWLPLHGIQFRRAGGDGWQYQMLARRVLTELKL
ncbi:hypothetical protein C8R44DRAFT_887632 [Mycena epipterygia]|nr:hypothetical protein C8R44DRAFT_887632 [Mycena epipterygia]